MTGDLKTDIQNALAPKIKEITGTMNNVEKNVNDQVLKVQKELTTKVCEGIEGMTSNVLSFKTDLSKGIEKIGGLNIKDRRRRDCRKSSCTQHIRSEDQGF